MLIEKIITSLETWAPSALQESYDNVGLLVGEPGDETEGALITLDVTEEVVDEAVRLGYKLILSHHPFLFSGLKRVNDSTPTGRILKKAIKSNISVYAMHTNLDNTLDGVNRMIGNKLGLTDLQILRPVRGRLRKLVTFCPADQIEGVREAVFRAGAGHIGNYDQCSYNVSGYGSFRAGEGTDPYVGEINKIHYEDEIRFETIFPDFLTDQVISALLRAHPYEEVAYDIYPLENEFHKVGSGMVGNLPQPLSENELLEKLKSTFGTPVVRHSRLLGRQVTKVAYCGGSGSFLIPDAIASGAGFFITGDVKYHQFFDADGKIIIADIGHYESEQFTRQLIYDYLKQNFANFALRISDVGTNSVNYF